MQVDTKKGEKICERNFRLLPTYLYRAILLFATTAHAGSILRLPMQLRRRFLLWRVIYTLSINDIEGFQELYHQYCVTAQLATLLKNSVQRERPNGGNNHIISFRACGGSICGGELHENRYGIAWGLPFYAVACVISVQRVNVDAHYWTDVIGWRCPGMGCCEIFHYLLSECQSRTSSRSRTSFRWH